MVFWKLNIRTLSAHFFSMWSMTGCERYAGSQQLSARDLERCQVCFSELTPQRVGNDRSAKGPVTFAPVEVPSLNTERQIHVEKVFQSPFYICAADQFELERTKSSSGMLNAIV